MLSCTGPTDLVKLWSWKESMLQFLNNKLTNAFEKAKEKLGPLASIAEKYYNNIGEGIGLYIKHNERNYYYE